MWIVPTLGLFLLFLFFFVKELHFLQEYDIFNSGKTGVNL